MLIWKPRRVPESNTNTYSHTHTHSRAHTRGEALIRGKVRCFTNTNHIKWLDTAQSQWRQVGMAADDETRLPSRNHTTHTRAHTQIPYARMQAHKLSIKTHVTHTHTYTHTHTHTHTPPDTHTHRGMPSGNQWPIRIIWLGWWQVCPRNNLRPLSARERASLSPHTHTHTHKHALFALVTCDIKLPVCIQEFYLLLSSHSAYANVCLYPKLLSFMFGNVVRHAADRSSVCLCICVCNLFACVGARPFLTLNTKPAVCQSNWQR